MQRLDHKRVALVLGLDHIIHIAVGRNHDLFGRGDTVFLLQLAESVEQLQAGDVR